MVTHNRLRSTRQVLNSVRLFRTGHHNQVGVIALVIKVVVIVVVLVAVIVVIVVIVVVVVVVVVVVLDSS